MPVTALNVANTKYMQTWQPRNLYECEDGDAKTYGVHVGGPRQAWQARLSTE